MTWNSWKSWLSKYLLNSNFIFAYSRALILEKNRLAGQNKLQWRAAQQEYIPYKLYQKLPKFWVVRFDF